MPCYRPLVMYPPPPEVGGRFVCSPKDTYPGAPATPVACGKCQGCRVRRTGEWVIRNLWELKRCDGEACFVTLTYDDESLPASYSVDVKELQGFLKRLRARLRYRYGADFRIRFFAVGEYGEREDATKRPHFHIIIFGWCPDDLVPEAPSQRGLPQWSSPLLSEVWNKGRVMLGNVDRHSISYVAGYVFDKHYGDRATEEYASRVHAVTGEVCKVRPPFNVMSRRPGIGARWFDEFRDTDARSSFVVMDGRKRAMPRAVVRRLLGFLSPEDQAEFVEKRRLAAMEYERLHAADLTPRRRATIEAVRTHNAATLARGGASKADLAALFDLAEGWAEAERRKPAGDDAALARARATLDARRAADDAMAARERARRGDRLASLEAAAAARGASNGEPV